MTPKMMDALTDALILDKDGSGGGLKYSVAGWEARKRGHTIYHSAITVHACIKAGYLQLVGNGRNRHVKLTEKGSHAWGKFNRKVSRK